MEDYHDRRQSQWKMTSRKPYRKQIISVCLASQSCTELGPAKPQLVKPICCLDLFWKEFMLLKCFIYSKPMSMNEWKIQLFHIF